VRAGRGTAIALIGAALCGTGVAAAEEGAPPAPPFPDGASCAGAGTAEPGAVAALHRMVNGARAQAGLPRLKASAVLSAYALRHSRDMAAADRLAHSMVGGKLPFAPASKAAGETLAVVATPWQAVKGWLGSPRHRATLLSGEFRLTGIGAVRTCAGALVVTQEFLAT
jgi:uncharacterized protein YkwD